MKNRILKINPNAKVDTFKEFYMPNSEKNIIDKSVNYIVDAVDTVTAKIEIILDAKRLNIPIISSMGTGNKLDPTKFEVADIYKTSICPLAKVMRKELKQRGIENLKVVYSKEEPIKGENEIKRKASASKHIFCTICCRFNNSRRSYKRFNKIIWLEGADSKPTLCLFNIKI